LNRLVQLGAQQVEVTVPELELCQVGCFGRVLLLTMEHLLPTYSHQHVPARQQPALQLLRHALPSADYTMRCADTSAVWLWATCALC
jgi:hypothetical protein